MKKLACFLLVLLLAVPMAHAEFIFADDADNGSLMEAGEGGTPAATQAPDVEEGWPRKIVVTVGGDCTLGCTENQHQSPQGFSTVVAEKGYEWPFSGLLGVFETDDLTLVNLEGPLTESTDKAEGKLFNFKGPAEYAQMLTLGSVEAVTLANNHFHDYGDAGKEDTKAALEAEGIVYCAPSITGVYEVRGVKIGLIGNTFPYTDGKKDISKAVTELREAGCQIVIASFHWGSEYEYAFTRDQRNIGRAAIRSGADVVVGHHPHVIQGIERFEESYILYSLGNLVFGGNVDPDVRDTYVAQLTFTVHEDGTVEGPELKLIPVLLTEQAKGTDYRPVLAEGADYERIVSDILKRSTDMKDFVNPE